MRVEHLAEQRQAGERGQHRVQAHHHAEQAGAHPALIAAGQAVGLTSEATANQNPRPGVAYRAVRDAPPIRVHLAWWRDAVPPYLPDLVALAREAYGRGRADPRATPDG